MTELWSTNTADAVRPPRKFEQVDYVEAKNGFTPAHNVLKMPVMERLRHIKAWQNALICSLIAHLLIVVALAASPQLHRLLHQDADHSDHECAVTVMVSGGSDGSPAPQIFQASGILPTAFDFSPELHFHDVAPLFLSAHVFEHAPPLA